MIEVLVAMLVLGSGAMAMIMLQLQALRSGRDSALQTRAMMMAVELAELRAEYHAGGVRDGIDPYLLSFNGGALAPIGNSCSAAACSPLEFAAAAVAGWTARWSSNFPGARAAVCRDGRLPSTIASDWSCPQDSTAPVYIKLGWRDARRFGGDNGTAIERPQLTMFIGY